MPHTFQLTERLKNMLKISGLKINVKLRGLFAGPKLKFLIKIQKNSLKTVGNL